MTDAEGVARSLLERGLLNRAQAVHGDLVVEHIARRHDSYRIKQAGGGVVIKVPSHSERASAIRHEASVYQYIFSHRNGRRARRFVPKLVYWDESSSELCIELIDGVSLREYHATHGRFSRILASQLASVLAVLHMTEVDSAFCPPMSTPWIFEIGCPQLGFVNEMSGATLDLVAILQRSDELVTHLSALRSLWQPDCLIHNDIRWDNCVVSAPPGASRVTRLRLVDWELATVGDPCWDMAAAISEYLSFWLLSIPLAEDSIIEEWHLLARHPLDQMRPAICRLWSSYLSRNQQVARDGDHFLNKTIRFAAARLVQAAIEHAQMSTKLSAYSALSLQVALNLLRSTENEACALLGIDAS